MQYSVTVPGATYGGTVQFSAAAINNIASGIERLRDAMARFDDTGRASTIVGSDLRTDPFSVSSGTSGLYFISGQNQVGGAISVEGGVNRFVGGSLRWPLGLSGNWAITTSGGQSEISLGPGADTVMTGGSDTVHAGSGTLLLQVSAGNTHGPTVDALSGFVTFVGGASGGAVINNGGSSGGLILLGSGGGNVARAGAGNTTLIGGGGGDLMYANTVTGAKATALYASGNDTMIGGGKGADTFYGYSSISGNGDVLIDVSQAQSGQVVVLGAGNDTVKLTSRGSDTVYASDPRTDGVANDLLVGWDRKDVLYLGGYASAPVFTQTAVGLQATLSDGTAITFAGITNQSAIRIVFGNSV